MFRRRRIIVFAFVAIALAWGGYAIWTYIASQSFLNQAIAETDALDPNWRLADMFAAQKPIPDHENSALAIMAGHRLTNVPDHEKMVRAEEAAYQELEFQNRCVNEHQKEALAYLATIYGPALGEYGKVSTMPNGRYPYVWTLTTQSSQLPAPYARTAIRILRFDLRHQLAMGDYDAADQRILAIINVAPSLGDETFSIAIVIRCAINRLANMAVSEWLAKSEPSALVLSQVQKTLENESKTPLASMFFKAERASHFEMLDNYSALWPPPASPWESIQNKFEQGLALGYFPTQKAYLLVTMNQMIDIVSLPTELQCARCTKCMHDIPKQALFANMALSTNERLLTSIHETLADQRCTITALATEQFRVQNKRWPDTLEQLVEASLIKTIPIDPFDGKPLRWKSTENGRLIYSIGLDRVDNGGQFNERTPKDAGNDIVFRLYDPAQRRLPPLPPKPVEIEKP